MVFQSAPAIAGGRINHPAHRHPINNCFNPRPPLLAGESADAPAKLPVQRKFQSAPAIAGGRIITETDPITGKPKVSIRARHCWRANPRRAQQWTHDMLFQSAPAIAGGRIPDKGKGRASTNVSIRARHCWRANPWSTSSIATSRKSFNPRPPLLAGESCTAGSARRSTCCFNPRPPLLAGESQ